jgi:hypothetical protein
LLAIGALVARVAALGLWIALRQTFEVGRGEIIEQQCVVEIKQGPLALGQRRFDVLAPRMEPIEIAVKRTVVQPTEVALQDLLRIQSGIACSERGAIRRLSTMASVSTQARSASPARARICDSPNSRHI